MVILDRPCHDQLIADVRGAAGARIKLIPDGDVAVSVAAGPGKAPDRPRDRDRWDARGRDHRLCHEGPRWCHPGALSTPQRRRAQGGPRCRLRPRPGVTTNDLVAGNAYFAATGISDGDLPARRAVPGDRATTQSIMTRPESGTVRIITAEHASHKPWRLSQ